MPIELRHRTYFAYLDAPKDVRKGMRRRDFRLPEGTVQDIVGHERSTLTGSTHSGKSPFEMRRDALKKLAYD